MRIFQKVVLLIRTGLFHILLLPVLDGLKNNALTHPNVLVNSLSATGSNVHVIKLNDVFSNSTSKIKPKESDYHNKLTDDERKKEESCMGSLSSRTSLIMYLECLREFARRQLILLKWDKFGDLQKFSPYAGQSKENWMKRETLRTLFARTQASKYGRVAMLYNSDVFGGSRWSLFSIDPPIPLMVYTLPSKSTNRTDHNLVLVPNPYDREGSSAIKVDVLLDLLHISAENQTSFDDFNKRRNVIVWRGDVRINKHRQTLLQLAETEASKSTDIWLDVAASSKNEPTTIKNKLSLEEMASLYRYQIDVGGASGTTWNALRWKMCGSGGLVFKVDTHSIDWWHNDLQPWKHYIPVKDDLSDLRKRFTWAENNVREAYQIAKQGQRVCLSSYTKEHAQNAHIQAVKSLPESSLALLQETDDVFENYLDKYFFEQERNPMEKTEDMCSRKAHFASLLLYLKCLSNFTRHQVVLLKWNSSGVLEKVSPIANQLKELWLKPVVIEELFQKTKPSKHGKVAMIYNSDVLGGATWSVFDKIPPVPFMVYTVPYIEANKSHVRLLPNPYDRDGDSATKIQKLADLYGGSNVISFEQFKQRNNIIVWRGEVRFNPWRKRLIALVEADGNSSSWIDAADSTTGLPNSLIPFVDMASKYRYQIDIGGASGTAWNALRWKMCGSGGLVFKVASNAKDWWHDDLVEWEHFIPVREDLSDLRENYEWVERNLRKGYEIAQKGQAVCLRSCSQETARQAVIDIVEALPETPQHIVDESNEIFNKHIDDLLKN